MKSFAMLLASVIAAVATIAASQEASPTPAPATTPRKIPRSVTTSGEIVRYDAGKTIVIRQSDDRIVTYELAPAVPVSADGVVRVTRVTPIGPDPVPAAPAPPAASVTPNAEIPSAAQAKTQTTTAYGTITAYEPGQSISILQPNGKTVIYAIDGDSSLPTGIATGKTVVVRTITRPGATRPLVQKVTYSRTPTTQKKG